VTRPLLPLASITERTLPSVRNLYEFKRIYALVSERYGGPDKSCLDYGCGSGYGSHYLSRHFGRVVGIDISDEAVRDCNQAFSAPNLEFAVFDPQSQPFPDESFDCVFSFQVMEHVPVADVNRYLHTIWNMVKPGGMAVITTPNKANYFGGHSGNPYHVKEYSAGELGSALRDALPDVRAQVMAQEDVLSTRTGIRIRRALRNRRQALWLARLVVGPLRALERAGLISTDHRDMLTTTAIDGVVGGFYVELRKPTGPESSEDRRSG
jgi:2-polyprenyl-3-methyl-5-hydroxy-6-metoxy-1,4-benzoquinol methylase